MTRVQNFAVFVKKIILFMSLFFIFNTFGHRNNRTIQYSYSPIQSESGSQPGISLEGSEQAASTSTTSVSATMKNPSAVYCLDLGYEYKVIEFEDGGQQGYCVLSDEVMCPSWDFLNGRCGQDFSICARNGYMTVTIPGGKNPFSKESAYCVDGQGNIIESVINMSGLFEKANGRYGVGQLSGELDSQEITPVYEPAPSTLPTSFDWRDHSGGNWMTPVKDQGMCGSCWAFAAVGASEAAMNIANNDPQLDLNLSEQYLVSGCSGAGNCTGGYTDRALDYIRISGIPDEACLPYLDGNWDGCSYGNTCDSSVCTYYTGGNCSDFICSNRCINWSTRLYKIQNSVDLWNSTGILKQALVDYGPLTVSMNMDGYFNEDGIYTCPDNFYTNHAVVIVGYDDPGGYWIVKNSWGLWWAEDGYFKVAYDNCAINRYAAYVIGGLLPMPPNNLHQSSSTQTSITLEWDDVMNETGYRIYRLSGSEFSLLASVGANVTTFTDSNLDCGETYSYESTAFNNQGESTHSSVVNATAGICSPTDFAVFLPVLIK